MSRILPVESCMRPRSVWPAACAIVVAAIAGLPHSSHIARAADHSLAVVARSGTPAPGVDPPVAFRDLHEPLLNPAGDLAFRGVLDDGRRGIWKLTGDGMNLVALAGEPAPEVTDGSTLASLALLALFDGGMVAFSARLGPGPAPSFWAEQPGGSVLIARDLEGMVGLDNDEAVANMTAAFSASGNVALTGRIVGPEVDTFNDTAVWAGSPGAITLAVREGERVAEIRPIAVNNNGVVAFGEHHGVWTWEAGGLFPVVFLGKVPPAFRRRSSSTSSSPSPLPAPTSRFKQD